MEFKKCYVCGCEHELREMQETIELGYICNDCFDIEQGYSQENHTRINKETKRGLTYSIEFETDYHNGNICRLWKLDFIPTSDGSINGREWKSPIINSLKGLKDKFEIIDKFGINQAVTENCGTHCHVGTIDNETKQIIHRFRHSIFSPMMNFLDENKQNTIEVWGRFFKRYCDKAIDGDHYSWINTNTEHPTIEWRLCKYKNAEQYYRLLTIISDLSQTIFKDIAKNIDIIRQYDADRYNQELKNKVTSIFKRLGYRVLKEYRLAVNK